jgi:Coenzyme PQQ synthesis protein D (PqqD)
MTTLPKARQDGLLAEEVDDELVVYDRETHRAHRLNRTARSVWQACDGQTTVGELSTRLQDELELTTADEDLVWLTLRDLEQAKLLEESQTPPPAGNGVSRRQLVHRLGLVGGLAALLPVVQTMRVPTPAQATTPPVEDPPKHKKPKKKRKHRKERKDSKHGKSGGDRSDDRD